MVHRLLFLVGVLGASTLVGCAPPVCCVEDGDCGTGLGCFEGRCTYPCETDDDCAPSEVCARPADGRVSGVCMAPGEDDGECRVREPAVVGDAGSPPHDAGTPVDAGPPDAGPLDAGPLDAGRPPDAGVVDAGEPDAGAREDAGVVHDAGELEDAGTFEDGGTFEDAGTFEDGGALEDAGTDEDAGHVEDAGTFEDAGALDAGPIVCVDDAFEENDDRLSAALLPVATTSIAAVVCPDDPDLFRLRAFAGETVTLTLGYDAPPGMRLTVSRPGQGVLRTSATGTGVEQVSFTLNTDGFVLVRVVAVATGAARPYTLVIDRAGGGGCVDDALEPNDSQQQATALSLPADVDASICAPDPDFFTLNPGNRTQLTVDLVENPAAGLVVTVLRRADFSILGIISASDGPTVVDLGDQPPGPLLFIVAGLQDADYTLLVD